MILADAEKQDTDRKWVSSEESSALDSSFFGQGAHTVSRRAQWNTDMEKEDSVSVDVAGSPEVIGAQSNIHLKELASQS